MRNVCLVIITIAVSILAGYSVSDHYKASQQEKLEAKMKELADVRDHLGDAAAERYNICVNYSPALLDDKEQTECRNFVAETRKELGMEVH